MPTGEMMVLRVVLSVFRWLFALWEKLPPGVKSKMIDIAVEAFAATFRKFYEAAMQGRAA